MEAFESVNNELSGYGSGGATCTLCIRVNNDLYIAYVGDSSMLIATREPILDLSIIKTLSDELDESGEPSIPATHEKSKFLIFCDDHIPENPIEYQRMLVSNPSVRCVYDGHSLSKYFLPSVYAEKKRIGYHKNVRSDPATLVVNQSGKALSMTRSLGDFDLKPEVTHIPTVKKIDLTSLSEGCIIIASDGVWDNWHYCEVQEFFTNEANMSADVRDVAQSFCDKNDEKATRNFGSSKDDVCGIVLYL
jgi:serine/threonine protein phosphatase PrpC